MDPAAPAPEEDRDEPKEERRWKRLARRVAFPLIVLELLGLAVFLGALLVGERSRVTLIALYLPRAPLLIVAVLCALLARFTGRRWVLPVQIVVCLVVLFPVMGFTVATPRSATSAAPIRLVTYNVYFGKQGRQQLLDEIEAMPADVIVIQAANSSMGEHVKERFPTWTTHQERELLLLSRFPVRDVVAAPNLDGGDDPAMWIKYVIDTPSGALRLYNVHPFSPRHAMFDNRHIAKNIADREAQIAGAVAAARADVPPFIIAGDTNLPVLSAIARRHTSGLTDAWSDVGFGFGFTFPARRRWLRIDRVFGSDGVRFCDARVGPLGASDHRPLFVDFELTP